MSFNAVVDSVIWWNPEHSGKIRRAFDKALNGSNTLSKDLAGICSDKEIMALDLEVRRLSE